jgi:hypothetical protein
MIKKWFLPAIGVALCSPALADGYGCGISAQTVNTIQSQLATVVNLPDANGGIFKPNLMWSAVVDRYGKLCSVIKTGDAWPGSRAIAIAKANTANDFSNSKLALSTANLYAPTQPGGSLSASTIPTRSTRNSLLQARAQISSRAASSPSAEVSLSIKAARSSEVWASAAIAPAPIMRSLIACVTMQALTKSPGVSPGGTDNISYAPITTPPTPPTGFQQPHCFPQDITP